jgi:hypothetical protein
MMLDALSREAELEEVTDALLVHQLRRLQRACRRGAAHRARARPRLSGRAEPGEGDLALPPGEPGILAHETLTFAELQRRLDNGASLVAEKTREPGASGTPLFVVTGSGALRVATGGTAPPVGRGDTVVVLD